MNKYHIMHPFQLTIDSVIVAMEKIRKIWGDDYIEYSHVRYVMSIMDKNSNELYILGIIWDDEVKNSICDYLQRRIKIFPEWYDFFGQKNNKKITLELFKKLLDRAEKRIEKRGVRYAIL